MPILLCYEMLRDITGLTRCQAGNDDYTPADTRHCFKARYLPKVVSL